MFSLRLATKSSGSPCWNNDGVSGFASPKSRRKTVLAGDNTTDGIDPRLLWSSPLKRLSPRRALIVLRRSNNIDCSSGSHALPTISSLEGTDSVVLGSRKDTVVAWMMTCCPPDVVPKILAFAGPQIVCSLAKTNRHWRDVMNREETWRVLCEELYKWKQDDDVPLSWKLYYTLNPCVPIDYSSVGKALRAAGSSSSNNNIDNCHIRYPGGGHDGFIQHSIRVWVRPGRYRMRRPVHIDATSSSIRVSIEMMEIPGNRKQQRVCFSSKSKNRNEPLFRVTQGELSLKNICLKHQSLGSDIWGGNAAIHINAFLVDDDDEEHEGASVYHGDGASLLMEQCDVTSSSGRGIVVMDGGQLSARKCYIHDCAATGIYMGGSRSRMVLRGSDITRNGDGNQGFITRGHSGIYMEQGCADIDDCNIAGNSSSGITVVSSVSDPSSLTLTNTNVACNGLLPLDLSTHQFDTIMADRSNSILVRGSFRPRTAMLRDELRIDQEEDEDW